MKIVPLVVQSKMNDLVKIIYYHKMKMNKNWKGNFKNRKSKIMNMTNLFLKILI